MIICTITCQPFGGEAGLLGGEAFLLPPPVDRTLHIHTHIIYNSYMTLIGVHEMHGPVHPNNIYN